MNPPPLANAPNRSAMRLRNIEVASTIERQSVPESGPVNQLWLAIGSGDFPDAAANHGDKGAFTIQPDTERKNRGQKRRNYRSFPGGRDLLDLVGEGQAINMLPWWSKAILSGRLGGDKVRTRVSTALAPSAGLAGVQVALTG